jgi:mRNA interferase RelE/StbE
MYSVDISKRAVKDILGLPTPMIVRIHAAIRSLSLDPRPSGCKKLVDSKKPLWRIRVGDYRVAYTVDDVVRVVEVRKVGHRKDIYL